MIRSLLCWLGFHEWESFITSFPNGMDDNCKPIFKDYTFVACKHCRKWKK